MEEEEEEWPNITRLNLALADLREKRNFLMVTVKKKGEREGGNQAIAKK